jgi:ketosteroid isomerase-like protein
MAYLKETIQAINNRYAAALMQPGAPGVENFFTQDADLLPPGPENLKGRAAIQMFWAAVCEKGGGRATDHRRRGRDRRGCSTGNWDLLGSTQGNGKPTERQIFIHLAQDRR